MKTSVHQLQLKAVKVYKPELDKGERNPYTSGDEIGNPYMQDLRVEIADEDVNDVLDLLESKGYDLSEFKG